MALWPTNADRIFKDKIKREANKCFILGEIILTLKMEALKDSKLYKYSALGISCNAQVVLR